MVPVPYAGMIRISIYGYPQRYGVSAPGGAPEECSECRLRAPQKGPPGSFKKARGPRRAGTRAPQDARGPRKRDCRKAAPESRSGGKSAAAEAITQDEKRTDAQLSRGLN